MSTRHVRPAIVAACVLAALVSPAGAGAKKAKPKRWQSVLVASYTGFSGVPEGPQACQAESGIGCVTFEVPRGARFVHVEIKDDAGHPVAARLAYDADGDGAADSDVVRICSSTPEPYEVEGGGALSVNIYQGPCLDPAPTPAVATYGNVLATFSNLP